MVNEKEKQDEFPCKLAISLPFPNASLASTALSALAVDAELSPLVRRTFSTTKSVLRVDYEATTNRMLRVAVNGFFDNVGVVVNVMKDLDIDVYDTPVTDPLDGVQGLVKG